MSCNGKDEDPYTIAVQIIIRVPLQFSPILGMQKFPKIRGPDIDPPIVGLLS